MIDLNRLGGLEWTRKTSGALTGRERRRLLGALARAQYQNLIGRIKLATGRRPVRAAGIDVDSFEPPDSSLARDAEQTCLEQRPVIVNHSYRTWMFGCALSTLDGAELDPELYYVASLLHDYGISRSTPGTCFTLGSAEQAMQLARDAGIDSDRTERLGDAICAHITPGVSVAHDGTLASYVQWGAMADVAGIRMWDVSAENVNRAVTRYPRLQLKREIVRLGKAEIRAVPKGRFAFARYGGLLLAVRLAPYDE